MELLQNSSQIFKDALYDLTRDMYVKGEIPDDYCNSIIVTIPKKQKVNTENSELTHIWIKNYE